MNILVGIPLLTYSQSLPCTSCFRRPTRRSYAIELGPVLLSVERSVSVTVLATTALQHRAADSQVTEAPTVSLGSRRMLKP